MGSNLHLCHFFIWFKIIALFGLTKLDALMCHGLPVVCLSWLMRLTHEHSLLWVLHNVANVSPWMRMVFLRMRTVYKYTLLISNHLNWFFLKLFSQLMFPYSKKGFIYWRVTCMCSMYKTWYKTLHWHFFILKLIFWWDLHSSFFSKESTCRFLGEWNTKFDN